MKFCSKCGNQLFDEAVMCPKCGCMVSEQTTLQSEDKTNNNSANVLAIVGFIFSFLIPLLGLCLSIGGVASSKDLNGKGQGLSIAGITVSIIAQIIVTLEIIAILNS